MSHTICYHFVDFSQMTIVSNMHRMIYLALNTISVMIYTFWNSGLVDGYLNSIQTKKRLYFLPQNLAMNYPKYFFSIVSKNLSQHTHTHTLRFTSSKRSQMVGAHQYYSKQSTKKIRSLKTLKFSLGKKQPFQNVYYL